MLRKFRVKINEKEYMVEMEELEVEPGTITPVAVGAPLAQAAVSTTTQAPTVPKSNAPAPIAASGEGDAVIAPMPGTVLDIKVCVGDVVKENQVLAVLEAMKMENEIVAPRAGTITAIPAMKGAPIDVGKTIVVIK